MKKISLLYKIYWHFVMYYTWRVVDLKHVFRHTLFISETTLLNFKRDAHNLVFHNALLISRSAPQIGTLYIFQRASNMHLSDL